MTRLLRMLPLLVPALVLLTPSRAEAKRGIVIISHGETIKHVADLPADKAEAIRKATGKNVKVGYKYNAFGVFWLDLWTWDGEHCLYEGDGYIETTPEQIANLMDTKKGKLSKPIFYIFPPGLMLILLGIAIWIPFAIRGKKQEKELAERFQSLMEDQRYKEAVDVFTNQIDVNEGSESPENKDKESAPAEKTTDAEKPDPFETAVRHLVERGVEEAEARENFGFVMSVLVAHAQSEDA